ncbi:MAG: hypothetical protein DMG58_11805 [Acidobacteria bacterium]|nr:MAG: hypothetical protein DMG58_11805 [Acidobacteriota bacterium]
MRCLARRRRCSRSCLNVTNFVALGLRAGGDEWRGHDFLFVKSLLVSRLIQIFLLPSPAMPDGPLTHAVVLTLLMTFGMMQVMGIDLHQVSIATLIRFARSGFIEEEPATSRLVRPDADGHWQRTRSE